MRRPLLACAASATAVAVLGASAVLVNDGYEQSPGQGELRTVTQGLEATGPPMKVPKRSGPRVETPPPPPPPISKEDRRQAGKESAREKLRKQERLRRRALTAEAVARAQLATNFRVASFNVLGASHTGGAAGRAGFGAGSSRMAMAVSYLRARAIDVVGFQEFEDPQYTAFANTAGEYAVWPARALGPKSIRFSIAWRTTTWTLAEARSIGSPYAGGGYIQMPYVKLRHNVTGREVWFANFHNPADTPSLGRNARWRAIATGIQTALAKRLRSETGLPVIITGDMNERAAYFCPMTVRTDLGAANGGSTGAACVPPRAMQVDWIFGSSDLVFSNYLADRSAPVPRMTDHPVVSADVYLAPGPDADPYAGNE